MDSSSTNTQLVPMHNSKLLNTNPIHLTDEHYFVSFNMNNKYTQFFIMFSFESMRKRNNLYYLFSKTTIGDQRSLVPLTPIDDIIIKEKQIDPLIMIDR
jgi:hypothetical protein